MPRRPRTSTHSKMSPPPAPESSTADLVKIVTNLDGAAKHLGDNERAEIEEAQRSVVEARYCGETAADSVRVL